MGHFTKISDYEQDVAELMAATQAIIDQSEREGRDLTSDELRTCESNAEKVRGLNVKIDAARQREGESLAELDRRIASGEIKLGDNAPQGSLIRYDNRGNKFAILNRDDKAADVYRPECKNGIGHYILANVFGPNKQTPEPIRNALSENVNTAGGFLVPDLLAGEWIDLMRARSVVMSAGTRTVMMGSESLSIPKLESDPTIAVKSENNAFTATDITIGSRLLNAYLAGAVVEMSRELAEDSRDMAAEMVTAALVRSLAAQVDKWGIQGTGSAEPVGILNTGGITETDGSVGAIAWTDVAAAAASVRASNHMPTACVLHPTIWSDLYESTTGDGANSASMWKGHPPTLNNVQFLPSTNCPLANMAIGDWSYYLMGIRTAPLVEVSSEAGDAFKKHQLWLKITSRFDFVTADDSAFATLGGITS
jgi:HK97 family phage major capsid protein